MAALKHPHLDLVANVRDDDVAAYVVAGWTHVDSATTDTAPRRRGRPPKHKPE